MTPERRADLKEWYSREPFGAAVELLAELQAVKAEMDELKAVVQKLVGALEGVGMNWKLGAPYGFDGAAEALEETAEIRRRLGL